jgi:Bacterial protein of unknown function (DUF899)
MSLPQVVSASEWRTARKEVQTAEEQASAGSGQRPAPEAASRAGRQGISLCGTRRESEPSRSNTTFAVVSRAPISKVEPFRRRVGWSFPWYSSLGSDLNYGFHVTLDEDIAPIEDNYRYPQEPTDIDPHILGATCARSSRIVPWPRTVDPDPRLPPFRPRALATPTSCRVLTCTAPLGKSNR